MTKVFVFFLFNLLSLKLISNPKTSSIGPSIGQTILNGGMGKSYEDELGFAFDYQTKIFSDFIIMGQYSYSNHSNKAFKIHKLILDLGIPVDYFNKFELLPLMGFGSYLYHLRFPGDFQDGYTMGFNFGLQSTLKMLPHFGFGPQILFHIPFNKEIDKKDHTKYRLEGSFWNFFFSFHYQY